MIDRKTYFDAVRETLFGGALTQEQVDGQTVILAVWEFQELEDVRHLAYMLASVFHECATRMWPITEYGSQSYLEAKEYYPYIGRGFIMLTWEDNYRRAESELNRELVDHPELALDCLIASRIMFQGMSEGWFTGRRLDQYFNEDTDDPLGAREIINGHDQDELIASYHAAFLAAIEEASE
jgi:putative chitinase